MDAAKEYLGSDREGHIKLINEMKAEGKTYSEIATFFNAIGVTMKSGHEVSDKYISMFMLENGVRLKKVRTFKDKHNINHNEDLLLKIVRDVNLSKIKKLAMLSNLID